MWAQKDQKPITQIKISIYKKINCKIRLCLCGAFFLKVCTKPWLWLQLVTDFKISFLVTRKVILFIRFGLFILFVFGSLSNWAWHSKTAPVDDTCMSPLYLDLCNTNLWGESTRAAASHCIYFFYNNVFWNKNGCRKRWHYPDSHSCNTKD